MTQEEIRTRERIVLATIECIERNGVQETTVRAIADEAGVNVAAINYYFGSKDRLLSEAMERTLREGTSKALRELDELIAETGDLRQSARRLMEHVFTGMLNYPRIAQWQLNDALVHGDYSSRSVIELNRFLDGFLDRVEGLLVPGKREELRMSLVQMWSGMFFVGMMPGIYGQFLEFDLRDRAGEYVGRLLDQFMPVVVDAPEPRSG